MFQGAVLEFPGALPGIRLCAHSKVRNMRAFVLERFFQKSREQATQIMLHVHRRGVGVCGVYTYEVAETKVTQVMDLARQNQHPLQCTIEKE